MVQIEQNWDLAVFSIVSSSEPSPYRILIYKGTHTPPINQKIKEAESIHSTPLVVPIFLRINDPTLVARMGESNDPAYWAPEDGVTPIRMRLSCANTLPRI